MTESIERVTALRFPVQAALAMPGSKSHANRAIICACLAQGQTVIQNATPCDDVVVMVENLKKMGFDVQWTEKKNGELLINGGLPPTSYQLPATRLQLFCGNAGTTLRCLVSLAALVPGEWVITGNAQMRHRPIGDLVSALRSLGAGIRDTNGCPPITVRSGVLKGGSVRLKADVSSQYLTSLLLIAPMLSGGLRIELDGKPASPGYVDLTEKVMADFAIRIERKLNTFFVQSGCYAPPAPQAGTPAAHPNTYDIEGDWSAAGAWMILNELTGSRISFTNLSPTSAQSDRMLSDFIAKLRKRGDVTIDCSSVPDQVMNLAVLAAFRQGKTVITGVANLRHKECDRLAVISRELQKAGMSIEENKDGLVISGKTYDLRLTTHYSLNSFDDHRMAICFAILGLVQGNISISNPRCVTKSYPQFFDHLRAVAASSRPIAIVGMRGAGKSGFARRLASLLKLRAIDIDRVFESRHGPIRHTIAENGWPAFRGHEEQLVAESLKPGIVAALGGGATESAKTRALLKREAIVIWIQATKAELLKRLRSGRRPPLSDLPLEDEVQKLMVERGPHYREVATITVASKLPFSRQLPFVAGELKKLVTSFHSH